MFILADLVDCRFVSQLLLELWEFLLFISNLLVGQRILSREVRRVFNGEGFLREVFFREFEAAKCIGYDVVSAFDVEEFRSKLF